MGIERLYRDDMERAYEARLRSPAPQVDPDFRLGSFLAAGMGGIPSAAMETLGSVRDFSRGIDEQYKASPRGQLVARELERRTGVAVADQYVMPSGDAQRMKAREFGPDPQTAHMADQVFHGLTRFGAKAVGAVVAAGPVGGAALLGTEEANTIYRDLIGRGIDSETALKVAAVQGAISAAGVVLPISGASMAATTAGKVGATAGLVAAGGPGAYVAQETLARDILQRAGYADEAAKHDPTDPLGLGMSLALPLLFGGASVARSIRSAKPTMEDVVKHIESGGRRFDKDGNLLTSPKGAQGEMQVMPGTATDPGFGVTPARDGSPDELARVGRDYLKAMTSRYGDNDKALAAYNAGPGAVDAAVKKHGDDWLANMPAETRQYVAKANKLMDGAVADIASRSPEVVDAARVKVLQETVQKSLPQEPEAYPRLMEAIDEVAAGRTPQVPDFIPPAEREANFAAWFGESQVTAEGGGPLVAYRGGATEDWRDGSPITQFNSKNGPWSGFFTSNQEVANRFAEAQLPMTVRGGAPAGVFPVYLKIERPLVVDAQGRPAKDFQIDASVVGKADSPLRAQLESGTYDGLILRNTSDEGDVFVPLRPEQVKSAIGNSGRFDPNSPSLTDPLPARTNAPDTTQAANPEAAAPARGAGTDAQPSAAEPGRPAADVQTAGVARTMAQTERQIVDTLATERPDMMVTLPGTNEAVRLADAVEMIRAQQALDESDADLVRAAVLCDLSP